jgi:papain like protease/uncharacterized protein DUF4384
VRRIIHMMVLCMTVSLALAQGDGAGIDPPDTKYATGAILTPKAKLRSFPTTPEYRAFLPPSVDLSASLPLPGHQGRQGSCVSWAVGYAVRAYYTRASDGHDNRRPENIPSPAYIHNSISNRGRLEGDSSACHGAHIPVALTHLEFGTLSLHDYPYRDDRCPEPTESQEDRRFQLGRFRIERWFRVDTTKLDQIKAELAQGHPVVFARAFAGSFLRHRGAGVYMRRAGEADGRGGHAIAIIGYDEKRQAMRIMNSWGRRWGDRGYAWVSYAEFVDQEAYVMRPVKTVEPPAPPPKPDPPAPPDPSPTPLVVSDLECSKVSVTNDGGKTHVTGFVGKAEQIEILEQRLKGQHAEIDVAVRPWPQCEALLTVDGALAAGDRPAVRILASQKDLQRGELLKIEVTSPRQPAHVHVAYIQADGSVVHLVQADADNLRTVERGRVLKFGDGEDGRAKFVVSPPFGPEMVIVLASRSPVFEGRRPATETEREFLTALRRALALRAKGDASAGIRAAVATLTTTEKRP